MVNRSIILYSIFLASSLGLTTNTPSVLAINGGQSVQTKIDPTNNTKSDFANGSKVDIPITGSRWSRKADYREQDKQKAAADADATKKAEEAQKQARQAQIDTYKQIEQMAVDANNQAVNFGKQGRWAEAITAHEKACKYDPGNKQFKINLSAARTAYGQQLLAKGSVSEACSLFRKAIAAAPDNGLAVRSLLAGIKKAGYDPSSAATRIKLGDQLKDTGDLEGASIEYNAAFQLDPSAASSIKMGDLAYSVGQVQQAANYYRMALTKDPDCGAAHRQIGFLEMAAGDQANAAASLRKALILDSSDVAAGTALVELWRRQVSANPGSAEHHLGLATALQLTNDFGGAESEYRQVEAIEPNNPGLALGRATLARAFAHVRAEKFKLAAKTLYSQGLKKEALDQISRAVALEPRNAGYQLTYGECSEAVGDYRTAHQAYLTCVLIDPQNNTEAAARAKRMESKGNATPDQVEEAAKKAGAALSQQYAQPAAPNSMAAPAQFTQQAPPQFNSQFNAQQAVAPSKNMFEGGNGAPSVPNSQLAFRTHDESPEAAAVMTASPQTSFAAQTPANSFTAPGSANLANPAAPVAQPSAPQASAMDAVMAKVSQAESQQDFATAINLLREVVNSDIKNADLHHRLAMDLQSSNELSEAVAEFRIAAALAPTKKDFADDFTRASAAHKKSMTNTTAGTEVPPSDPSDPSDASKRAISGINVGASK